MNILFLIIPLLVLNLYVNIRLFRKVEYDQKQKILQSFIIWLIPFLGACAILFFMHEDETPKGPDKSNFGGGPGSGITGES